MITINLIGNATKSNDPKAYTLEKTNHFGKKEGNVIEFSLLETLFLMETKKTKLVSNKKELSLEETEKKFTKIDKKFQTKYAVYKDLRKKGYIPKTALKFGAEFRVYEKGKKAGAEHSKWIVFTDQENNKTTWHEFAAKNRVAHSTNKNVLLAIVDEENQITYYEIKWTKP